MFTTVPMSEIEKHVTPDGQTVPGDYYHVAHILSASPLVTFSLTNRLLPAGLASFASDLIGERRGLHLLHHSWTLEEDNQAEMIAAGVRQAQTILPGSDFIMLCSNDMEVLACHKHGLKAMVGSALIFTDERLWYPRRADPTLGRFDAAYVARLDRMKRHELASQIGRPLFIYGQALEEAPDEALDRLRSALPRAHFFNHDANGGRYQRASPDVIARLFAVSGVGLCLSAIEGCMRATMEYLLCGLPVVSTPSTGGRDRYLGTGYCRVVDQDDPEAIAHAVHALSSLNLDRQRVRDHVGQVLAFDRHNFLLALNKTIRSHFDLSHDLFPTIAPFLGRTTRYEAVDDLRRSIETAVRQP